MKRKTKKPLIVRFLVSLITFKWLLVFLVWFYKKCISPLSPNVCIYYPTCSTYMLLAIEEWGVLKGVGRGIARIWRCRPFKEGGIDPVPDNPKGDLKWLL